jgi:NAD-dependent SIR2 family protein deacetylase
LPIKPNKFDLILLTEVLEHLDKKTYSEAIAEVRRLNAKYILITVPYKEDIDIGLCKCAKCGNLFNTNHHRLTFNENKIVETFPDYVVESVKYESYRIRPNVFLFKLKQKLGLYSYSDASICDKCGSRPVRPHMIWRYIFGIPNRIDMFFKRMVGLKKPYHLMMLMRKS